MCFTKFRYIKNTIKSIRRMNKVLHTNFSYVLCVEELEFLEKIPKNTEVTNKYRLEHLQTVLGLWHKGLKEDYLDHNKTKRNYDRFKPLFDEFVANYIYELGELKVLDEYSDTINYKLELENYKVKFREYDYLTIKQKSDDIRSNLGILDSFNLLLSNSRVDTANDEYLSKFIKFDYYGPMCLLKGYKKIEDKVENFSYSYKDNPYNNMVKSIFVFRYNGLVRRRNKELVFFKKDYYKSMIDVQRKRLSIELDRLEMSDNRYDYYFDAFMWRLENDAEYLFLKRLGGIKKVSELININDKSKKIKEKEAIVVDVDRMVVVDKKGNNSSGGGTKKTNALNIKGFEEIHKDEIIRKERLERQEQIKELERERRK